MVPSRVAGAASAQGAPAMRETGCLVSVIMGKSTSCFRHYSIANEEMQELKEIYPRFFIFLGDN